MEKIVIHWTAGADKPCSEDLQDYHYIFDGKGKMHKGKYKPEDNLNTSDGKYAEHTGGGNTGAIGVSMCGMYGFKNSKTVGKFPITAVQLEACLSFCAALCKKYGIDPENVITHYEFGLAHKDTTSFGKIDIIYLPPHPELKANEIGGFLRNKIRWYIQKG